MFVTEDELLKAVGVDFVGFQALADLVVYTSGTGAPTANATRVGAAYFDTTNDHWYLAVAVGTGASDWKQITA